MAEEGEGPPAGPDPRVVRLILALRNAGIADSRTLAAIEAAPREQFVPRDLRDLAYLDQPLPIECGQTISQPMVVATMTEALDVKPAHRVLEVGTGSGYQTAILAKLAAHVTTIERWPELLGRARARLAALRIDNVDLRVGDGALGAPDAAPFDRILVTAAASRRPEALIAQLSPGGVLIAPIGGADRQTLMRYVRTERGVKETALLPVRFVPLLPGLAAEV
jgi:protein-L-isoaspartate(D-aspartate) O-methyltransferase